MFPSLHNIGVYSGDLSAKRHVHAERAGLPLRHLRLVQCARDVQRRRLRLAQRFLPHWYVVVVVVVVVVINMCVRVVDRNHFCRAGDVSCKCNNDATCNNAETLECDLDRALCVFKKPCVSGTKG
jgi:hypothetical protein